MSGRPASVGLGLMCKPPRPGVTKTRLAAQIGAVAAAALSQAFLSDCANAASAAADDCALDLLACFRPEDAASELGALLGAEWPLVHADSGDLGATMRDVLANLLERSPGGAIIMGADVPLIDAATISEAARLLRAGTESRVVIGPTFDGGYWLIGVRSLRRADSLFAPLNWGTPEVFAQTERRARASGLDLVTLPMQRDIDEAGDLHWLRAELARSRGNCPATRAALASLSGANAALPEPSVSMPDPPARKIGVDR